MHSLRINTVDKQGNESFHNRDEHSHFFKLLRMEGLEAEPLVEESKSRTRRTQRRNGQKGRQNLASALGGRLLAQTAGGLEHQTGTKGSQ